MSQQYLHRSIMTSSCRCEQCVTMLSDISADIGPCIQKYLHHCGIDAKGGLAVKFRMRNDSPQKCLPLRSVDHVFHMIRLD